MINLNCLTALATTPLLASIALASLGEAANAVGSVKVSCVQQDVPKVVATLSNKATSQQSTILSFLPQYFSAVEASAECESVAQKLNVFYNQDQKNYLASDTIDEKPVICAVERRGLNCDSYGSDILFSLNQSVNPAELLYDMLGNDFKGSQLPSSRTVSRIYTDLKPFWWPFE